MSTALLIVAIVVALLNAVAGIWILRETRRKYGK